MDFIFINKQFAMQMKENIKKGSGRWEDIKFELQRKAERCMNIGPWSITFNKSPAASGNIHDYFSEGRYWWPNPKDPNGAYIRKDGEVNLNNFMFHRNDMTSMVETVIYLSLAGYYLEESMYSDRALELIKVWFLDEATKMNPHLEYAQAIRGICDGRGIGIIDTVCLIGIIYAAGFIMQDDRYHEEICQLKKWFEDYLIWLTTSEKGLQSREHGNNHSNWWNTQVATYSDFVGNTKLLFECFERFKSKIVPMQMDSDGSFKDELTRTRSFTYNLFNLTASTLLCEIAYYKGIDLWHFKTEDDKGMEAAIKFILPYIENPFLWEHKQIAGEVISDNINLQLGGLRLKIKKCTQVNRVRGKDFYLIRNASVIGPLSLLPGFAMN